MRLRVPLILIFILATTGLMTPDVRNWLSDFKARQWTVVPAEITKFSAPVTVLLRDPYFDPRVEYKYSVDGKEYLGNRRSFYQNGPLLGYDQGIYRKDHAVGKQVNVMVEQGRPENSLMEPDTSWVSLFSRFLAVAIFCGLIYLSTYPPVLKAR